MSVKLLSLKKNEDFKTLLKGRKLSNIDQEGIESQIDYNNESVLFSVFTNFSKSRSASGSHQSRRPDLSYGFNFGNFSHIIPTQI